MTAIMSNPDLSALLGSLSGEDFESLKQIASSLLGASGDKAGEKPDAADALAGIDLNNLSLPDMTKFASLAPILAELTKKDEKTDFLMSLKPFLSDERKPKADEAARLLRLVNLIPLLRERGVL